MAENDDDQRDEREWRREAVLLAVAMGMIAGLMIWRGWEDVSPFDANTFSYVSDITTTLVNLGLLYAALVRGRSLIKWVLRQWEILVATSPRIQGMFLSLWPRRSAAKAAASGNGQHRGADLAEPIAPISAGTEPSPELRSHDPRQSSDPATDTRRGIKPRRYVWPMFIVLAFVGAMVGVVLLGNALVEVWKSDREPAVVQVPTTRELASTTETEAQEYIVPFRTPRVSCRLIARSFAPSRDGGEFREIVRLNDLTDECRISYGATIKLPAEWDTSQPLD